MTEFIVERLVPDQDLDDLLELQKLSFTNPWTREMFQWELQNSDVSHVFVLRAAGQAVAGFCSFWLVFEELHINNFAIRPELRRRGFGAALLEQVLREGARLGARRATLEVRRSNEPARRLYERAGFTLCGSRPRYYRNPDEDALILWREDLNARDSAETA